MGAVFCAILSEHLHHDAEARNVVSGRSGLLRGKCSIKIRQPHAVLLREVNTKCHRVDIDMPPRWGFL